MLYDVHLFPVVHVKISNVEADSKAAAIEKALAHAYADMHQRVEAGGAGGVEFSEEYSHFLVDVVGDEEYRESEYFTSMEEPTLEPIRKILAWYRSADRSSASKVLDEIMDEFQKFAEKSV